MQSAICPKPVNVAKSLNLQSTPPNIQNGCGRSELEVCGPRKCLITQAKHPNSGAEVDSGEPAIDLLVRGLQYFGLRL
eukprot:5937281-Alexandrium_andersonii.AAC.1